MATPNEKLAASLAKLQALQNDGRRVFRSSELTRTHRERLLANGFLRDVIKGWLISSSTSAREGDTTPWYAAFWEFCTSYCQYRFGDIWHLSPEHSILIHAENTVIPQQVIIYTPKGTNNTINLPFDTSFYDFKEKRMPHSRDIAIRNGLRLYKLEAALIKISENFYTRNPLDAQTALSQINDETELLRRLLEGGHSVVAGRIAGAFRAIGRSGIADEILNVLTAAGYYVRESNPFEQDYRLEISDSSISPIVKRVQVFWSSMREVVIDNFPKSPGLPEKSKDYMRLVDEIYQHDAYHSLSIEGYNVTPELIQKAAAGNWSPENNKEDRKDLDALAARGYWQAFQLVKKAVADVLDGENPGEVVNSAHRIWHRELFQPYVRVGVIPASSLAGYRNTAVFIRGSRHAPPRWEGVRDAMPGFFTLLEQEPEPCVKAVLGHWLFGCIHPYMDGNGRMARFLMNTMLASGGYPWTVIRVENRDEYLRALENASIDLNIKPFTEFIARQVEWSMKQASKRLINNNGPAGI